MQKERTMKSKKQYSDMETFMTDVANFMTMYIETSKTLMGKLTDFEKRLEKVEEKYLSLDKEDLEPDIPVILEVIDGKLQEFNECEDYARITKRELIANQIILFDALKDLLRYSVIKGYAVDLMDQQVARLTSYNDLLEEAKAKENEKSKRAKDTYI